MHWCCFDLLDPYAYRRNVLLLGSRCLLWFLTGVVRFEWFGEWTSSAVPVEQKHHRSRHESSSVGARSSSAAPIEPKHHRSRHESSSVGARSSSAAPIEPKPHPSTHEPLLSERVHPRPPHRSEAPSVIWMAKKSRSWSSVGLMCIWTRDMAALTWRIQPSQRWLKNHYSTVMELTTSFPLGSWCQIIRIPCYVASKARKSRTSWMRIRVIQPTKRMSIWIAVVNSGWKNTLTASSEMRSTIGIRFGILKIIRWRLAFVKNPATGRLVAPGFVSTDGRKTRWYRWTGAAEDGRAPTEERSRVKGWGFWSTGGRPRTAALRLKMFRVLTNSPSVRWQGSLLLKNRFADAFAGVSMKQESGGTAAMVRHFFAK